MYYNVLCDVKIVCDFVDNIQVTSLKIHLLVQVRVMVVVDLLVSENL